MNNIYSNYLINRIQFLLIWVLDSEITSFWNPQSLFACKMTEASIACKDPYIDYILVLESPDYFLLWLPSLEGYTSVQRLYLLCREGANIVYQRKRFLFLFSFKLIEREFGKQNVRITLNHKPIQGCASLWNHLEVSTNRQNLWEIHLKYPLFIE